MAHLQGKAVHGAISGTDTFTITLASALSSGSWVAIGGIAVPNGVTVAASDAHNVYVAKDTNADVGNSIEEFQFQLGNIIGGSTNITITFGSGATNPVVVVVDEYSSILSSSDPTDGHALVVRNTPGAGANAILSTAITTASNGDTIWSACFDTTSTPAPTAGTTPFAFNARESDTGGQTAVLSEDGTQTTAGSIQASFTSSTNGATDNFIVMIMAAKAAPAAAVWGYFDPLNEPVRAPATLVGAGRQFLAEGLQPIIPKMDWLRAMNEPVRLPAVLPNDDRQFWTAGFLPIIPKMDWFRYLEEPVRKLPSLAVGEMDDQQFFTEGLVPIIPKMDWFKAFAEPVVLPRQPITQVQAYAVNFTIPTPGWYNPLSEPTRAPPALAVADQQFLAFTAPWFLPSWAWFGPLSTPIPPPVLPRADMPSWTAGFLPVIPKIDWYLALTEPARLPPPSPATYQYLALTQVVATVTVNLNWFQPLSNPLVAPVPALIHQTIGFNIPAATAVVWGWYWPLSEPARQPPTVVTPPIAYAANFTIPTFGWFEPLTEPARFPPPPQLSYQFEAYPANFSIPTFGWYSALSEPAKQPTVLPTAQFAAWVPLVVTVTVNFGWFAPLAQPVVQPPFVFPHTSAAFTIPQPSWGWFGPLAEPIRLPATPPPAALTFPVNFSIPTFGWYEAFTEPARAQPVLAQASQQFEAFQQPIVVVTVKFDWFQALGVPVRAAPVLPPADQPYIAFTAPWFLPSTGWYEALSEPVRLPATILPADHQTQAFTAPWFLPSMGWYEAFAEPARQPPSLPPAQHQTLGETTPVIIPSFGWYRSLEEPVRLPPTLAAALRFVTQQYPAMPPIVVFDNAALSAIEQGDQAQFTLTVFNMPSQVIISVHLTDDS